MPGPAATVGSNHVCPMFNPGSPPPPHVGGPVSGPGVPTVLIGGKPAAVMGDMCVCAGPPDTIVMGVSTVLIGGKPAATVGDMTAHGGSIVVGDPTVLIGTSKAVPSAVMPINKIPFPDIKMSSGANAAAAAAQESIREAAAAEEVEKEPTIYNLQWIKEEERIRGSKVIKEVTLRANVKNLDDGESVTFTVKTPTETEGEEETVTELTGTVKDKMVEVVWEVEDREPMEPYEDGESNAESATDNEEDDNDENSEDSITMESSILLEPLKDFANENDEKRFVSAMLHIYGIEINYETYANLYDRLKNDEIACPPIEVISKKLKESIVFDPDSTHSETNEHGEGVPIIVAFKDLIEKSQNDEAVHERVINKLEDAFENYIKFLLENELKVESS